MIAAALNYQGAISIRKVFAQRDPNEATAILVCFQ